MSSFIHPLLSLHGPAAYLLVAALCFGEAALFIGFVLPGETAIIYGGVLASEHQVSLVGMLLVAVVCATVGYTVGYEIGRRFGPTLLRHRPLKERAAVARTQEIVRTRGTRAVVIGRFIPVVRALVPGVAGMSGLPYRRFQLANFGAGIVWACGYTTAGFLAGKAYGRLIHDASIVVVAIVAVVLSLVAVHLLRRRRERASESRPARSTIDHAADIITSASEQHPERADTRP